MEISTLLFGGRLYTIPFGRRLWAVWVPLKICKRTGVVGGVKLAPLMR
jgi:hypothetical protein